MKKFQGIGLFEIGFFLFGGVEKMVFSHLIRFSFSPSSNMLSTYQGGTSFKREMEVIYFPTIMSSCRYRPLV